MPGTPPEAHWTYQEEVSLVGGGDIWAAAQGLIKEAREALLWQLLRRRENASVQLPVKDFLTPAGFLFH